MLLSRGVIFTSLFLSGAVAFGAPKRTVAPNNESHGLTNERLTLILSSGEQVQAEESDDALLTNLDRQALLQELNRKPAVVGVATTEPTGDQAHLYR